LILVKHIFKYAKTEINWVIHDESVYNQFLDRELYELIKSFVKTKRLNICILHAKSDTIFRTCLNNLFKYINFYSINSSNPSLRLDFITWDNVRISIKSDE
jgi:hypothetical protein